MTTLPVPEAPHAASTPTASRAELLAHLREQLDRSGVAWAWQGASDAPARWTADRGPSDLDVWVGSLPGHLTRSLDALPAARVAEATHPRRLRHVSWAVPLADGPAVLDLTVGDLRVGPLLLVPAEEVEVVPGPRGPRLSGCSAVADLFLRPLLRGTVPQGLRLAEAARAWRSLDRPERRRLLARLEAGGGGTGRRWGRLVERALDGPRDLAATTSAPYLPPQLGSELLRLARTTLVRATVHPAALPSTWQQRRTIVPAGRRSGPLGLRTRGVVVALVGTDGSGKSHVQDTLDRELGRLGLRCRRAYFGMARGNLPGIALARRLLGVAPAGTELTQPASAPAQDERPVEHRVLRRVAAWVYAVEYVGRWVVLVAPGLLRREVVLCDRWVTDLRESPWPGSRASRVLEAVLPGPDVLVLPDAPDALIHARKPERSPQAQAEQQQAFRDLLDERPARWAEVVVDTSGREPDTARAVSAVLEAVHRAPGRRRR